MKFSIKDFFSKCDQITGNLVTFIEESLMENFIFCTVRILQQVMLQLRQNTKKDRH